MTKTSTKIKPQSSDNPLPKGWQVIKWECCKPVYLVIDNRGHIYPQTRAKTAKKCLELFKEGFTYRSK